MKRLSSFNEQAALRRMTEKNGLPASLKDTPFDASMFAKGIILDFSLGNYLRLDLGGNILHATHGTKARQAFETMQYLHGIVFSCLLPFFEYSCIHVLLVSCSFSFFPWFRS